MSQDDTNIEKLQSEGARLASVNRQTQDNIDAALAEVDRLKTIAIDLDKSNKEKEALFHKQEQEFADKLKSIKDDIATASKSLDDAKKNITSKEAAKAILETDIRLFKEEITELENDITSKRDELDSITLQIENVSRNSDKQVEVHRLLMSEQHQELGRFTVDSNNKKSEINDSLTKIETKLTTVSKNVEIKKNEMDSVLERIENYLNEISELETNKINTQKELDEAKVALSGTIDSIQAQDVLLKDLKKEVETVQTELKPLIAKRIDSAKFIEDLNNRENTLKKRYEDVGLEY